MSDVNSILKEISDIGIIPVITIADSTAAVLLADALDRGGIPCAEITFRTPAARDAVAKIAKERPDMLIGAGTILTIAQADAAIDAGADFIVTPGLNPEVVRHCTEKGVTVIPGVNSPLGIETAISLGLETVKFFPARESGGHEFIKAVSAPYPMIKFIPTGGIGPDSMNDYLRLGCVSAVGGSWLASARTIEAGDFDGITKLCREAVDRMLGMRLLHVGVNCGDGRLMKESAEKLERLFSFSQDVRGDKAIFSGGSVELLAGRGRGEYGHIAIAVKSADRAFYHLSRRGAEFDMSTAIYGGDGRLKAAYLKDEIAGFGYHIAEE